MLSGAAYRPASAAGFTMHSARITGPIPGLGIGGKESLIPLGPCLVEQLDGHSVDICWGEAGDKTAALTSRSSLQQVDLRSVR